MDVSLEAYDQERADFEKVLDGVRAIQSAPIEKLRDPEFLAAIIRRVGLVPIPAADETYGDDDEFINASSQGLIQIPLEFARYLALLADFKINRYIEVGCYTGGTVCLTAALLARFNPNVEVVALDIAPTFLFFHEARKLLPLRYEVGKSSFDFRDEKFDGCLIDANHTFDWCFFDYENVGRDSAICGLHDIFNEPYLDLSGGGVPAFWELLASRQRREGFDYVEISEHHARNVMGIGVVIDLGRKNPSP